MLRTFSLRSEGTFCPCTKMRRCMTAIRRELFIKTYPQTISFNIAKVINMSNFVKFFSKVRFAILKSCYNLSCSRVELRAPLESNQYLNRSRELVYPLTYGRTTHFSKIWLKITLKKLHWLGLDSHLTPATRALLLRLGFIYETSQPSLFGNFLNLSVFPNVRL